MLKLFETASAVRGCHYYRKYWQPKESQSLECVHEKDNLFDFFAIKVMDQDTRDTVGHLSSLELQTSSLTEVLEFNQSSFQPITVFRR